jgi:hypothetical protein
MMMSRASQLGSLKRLARVVADVAKVQQAIGARPRVGAWCVVRNPGPTRRLDTLEAVDLRVARAERGVRYLPPMVEVSLPPERLAEAVECGLELVRWAK